MLGEIGPVERRPGERRHVGPRRRLDRKVADVGEHRVAALLSDEGCESVGHTLEIGVQSLVAGKGCRSVHMKGIAHRQAEIRVGRHDLGLRAEPLPQRGARFGPSAPRP